MPSLTEILFHILLACTPDVETSIDIAANVVGRTASERRDLHDHLRHTGARESTRRPIGIHERDAGRSPGVWAKAVRAGWLRGQCASRRYAQQHDGGWSSRGAFGLMAAYNLRWLGVSCAPPWVLDIPIVSAYAAARKSQAKCWRTFTADGGRRIRELDPRGANGWCR